MRAMVLASLLLALVAGCDGDRVAPPRQDMQIITDLIAVIGRADGDWSAYVARAKALQAIGHIKIDDLSAAGYHAYMVTYAPGSDAPSYEWITLDREYIGRDPCLGAQTLVHELAHLITHTYAHQWAVDTVEAQFKVDCNG